jgi:MFS family permease
MSSPASLDPLRERAFLLLFLGQALSRLGSSLVPVALAFAAYEVSGSAGGVGLVLMASRLPQVAFVLVGGVLADRLPRNAVMLASDLIRAAAQATTAVLLATGHATIALLVALQLVHGAALAFFDPAMTGLVPQTVSPGRLQRANALLGLTGSSMAVLGQVLVGVIVSLAGVSLAFALDAATYVASAALLALLRLPTPAARVPARFGQAFRGGFAEFRARTWLWVGSLHIALLNAFAIAPFFVLGPVVSARALGGAGAWAAVAAAYALGLVCGGALALRWRPRRPVFAALAVIVFAAPQLALLAIEAPVPLVVAAGFLGGAETAVYGVLWTTALQQRVPAEAVSRTAAWSSLLGLALAPPAFALTGVASDAFGTSAVLGFGAVYTVVSTLVVLTVPAIRAEQDVPAAAPLLPSKGGRRVVPLDVTSAP